MSPFMIGLAASGGILFLSAFTGKGNETAIKIVLEVTKLGGVLYLLEHIRGIFL